MFLLPLIVVGALVGQAAVVVWGVVSALQEYLRDNQQTIGQYVVLGPALYATTLAVAVALLVLACFVAGLFARRKLGRWFTERAERYLMMLFPRYAVFKDQLTGNLGEGTLRPVSVVVGGVRRIGMEVERGADGLVTVYLPTAPDPWSGALGLFEPEEVTPVDREAGEVMAAFERLGRGLQ